MGRIICPDGSIVKTTRFDGSFPYAWLIRDVIDDKFSEEYKITIINIIAEIGIYDIIIINHVRKLRYSQNIDLKKAASKILENFYK